MAEERLRAISEVINFHLEKEPEPGFFTGLAGEALFLYHFGRTFGSDRHENQGFLALRRCLQILELGFTWPSYAAGIAGIRYTLHYLADSHFITPAEGAALDDAEPYLLRFAEERLQSGDYDLLHGALGIIMNHSSTISPFHSSTLPLLHSLISLSQPTAANHLSWSTTNPKTGTPEINLGLAHGIPSILLILSKYLFREPQANSSRPKGAVREPQANLSRPEGAIREPQANSSRPEGAIRPSEARTLLESGMAFLLSCQLEPGANGSLFPHRIVDGKPDQPGRLAWCYGDPGVGAAVWQIGANCGRDDWKAEGVRILRRAAARQHAKENRISDACLCHGSAGLALIFYKMALLTGHEEFLDASDHWMRATLDYGHEEHYAGGYRYLTTGERYISNYSLLEGLAGTGMAILTLMEPDQNLGWEQALLL